MKRLKIIDKSIKQKCWRCGGTGIEDVTKLKNITQCPSCKTCKGTGTFIRKFYHFIYTDKRGNKLCFGVDSLK